MIVHGVGVVHVAGMEDTALARAFLALEAVNFEHVVCSGSLRYAGAALAKLDDVDRHN